MKVVGEALEMDITGDEYDYVLSEEQKSRSNKQIMRYVTDFIHEKTNEVLDMDKLGLSALTNSNAIERRCSHVFRPRKRPVVCDTHLHS